MSSTQPTLLCHYRYDPLDRLINQNQPDQPAHQRFYCKSRLATEIQGAIQHSIIQHGDQLLAQRERQGDVVGTTLLATDLQRSVLQTLKANHQRQPIAYSPYGHRPAENGLLSLLGFNGERRDLVTGCYLLGNGYRAFNSVLMRFNSPDSLSPFEKGGLNAYAYCFGDPINLSDPNGQFPGMPGHIGLVKAVTKYTNKLIKLTSKNKYSKYKTLQNQHPTKLELEHSIHINHSKKLQTKPESSIKQISTRNDLKKQDLTAKKFYNRHIFIFTDQGKLFTAAPYKTEYLPRTLWFDNRPTHAVTAKLSKSKNIISAGEIWGEMPNININNHSGHYRPTLDSLTPVIKYPNKKGANVSIIRAY